MSFSENFLQDFNSRFSEFREIEATIIKGKYKDNACSKAFSLLYNMELCYAAGSYYACLIIACSAIEASLNHELGNNGTLQNKLKRSGYAKEADWLRLLRNEIVHKNDSTFVDHYLNEEQVEKLKEKCKSAFRLVHNIYYKPIKS